MNSPIVAGILSVALMDAAHGQVTAGAKCAPPPATVTSSVTQYVFEKNHLNNASQLTLLSNRAANDDCYWQYRYQIEPSQREVVLYLAPDHRYLTPNLFDRTLDPLIEEKEQRQATIKALSSATAATRGAKDAAVTVVEFSDFQCPYCQRLANTLATDILPSEPDVKLVFRNFPLSMHPWAEQAAEIAACAQMQSSGAFWKLHDYLFANQRSITAGNVSEKLLAVADADSGLKRDALHSCVDQALSMGPVAKDVETGRRFGVKATPTLFINGTKVEGIRDAAQLKQLIQSAREGKLAAAADALQPGPRVAAANKQAAVKAGACDTAQ